MYLTARDEARWIHALFDGVFPGAASRAVIVDTAGPPVGYGWFRRSNARLGELAYYMNGRAPGFASFALHLPQSRLTVVVLSNVYSSATTTIGNDIAAIVLGKPYAPFTPGAPLTTAELQQLDGHLFKFGPDFYQPNARLLLDAKGKELCVRRPNGDLTPMIPLERDHFLDRAYWVPVSVERDSAGHAVAMRYDRFRGPAVLALQ